MRRRALLAALTTVSGCSGLTGVDETPTPDSESTPNRTETPAELPYRGDGSELEVEPRGLPIHNRSDREQYVTVVVEHDGETLFVESTEVPGSGGEKEFEDLVAVAGIYRVVVETADGSRTVHDWVVSPDAGGLSVVLEDEFVWTNQRATCSPTCRPFSLGGDAVESLPYRPEGEGERTLGGTALVVLENSGETAEEVRVAAELDGKTLLDYRYEVHPGPSLTVPVVSAVGVVNLTLEADGTTERYEWHVPEERFVFSDVADGVGANCRLPRQYRDETDQRGLTLDRVHNRGDESHTLSVSVRGGGELLAEDRYEVGPESSQFVGQQWKTQDPLTLDLELDTGERLSATWNVCPSRSRSYSVGIDPDGTLALLNWDRPILTSGEWNERGEQQETATATPTPAPTATPTGTPTDES